MGKNWMTDETLIVVKVGLIDDYERRIGKLHQELNEAKAGKIMLVESKVAAPVNEMGIGAAPVKREYRIKSRFTSAGKENDDVIIVAESEAEAVKKFYLSRCTHKIQSVSLMPDLDSLRSDIVRIEKELAEVRHKAENPTWG